MGSDPYKDIRTRASENSGESSRKKGPEPRSHISNEQGHTSVNPALHVESVIEQKRLQLRLSGYERLFSADGRMEGAELNVCQEPAFSGRTIKKRMTIALSTTLRQSDALFNRLGIESPTAEAAACRVQSASPVIRAATLTMPGGTSFNHGRSIC